MCADRRAPTEGADQRSTRGADADSRREAVPASDGADRLRDLAGRTVFFLDRDGTLTLSERKLPHVDAFLAKLRATGRRFFVLTNNSSKSPRRHWENFRRMGLDVAEADVLVSIQPALAHLRSIGAARLHLVANAEVTGYVRAEGFDPAAADPQAVLLTYDTEITYAKLLALVAHLRRGVPYYATHVDVVCPTPDGPVPDIGTTLKTIEMTVGVDGSGAKGADRAGLLPLRTFGKPSHDFVRPVLDALGLGFGDAVVIGDRLYTDLELAQGTDMLSILVLTGETTREAHAASAVRADIVVPDLGALIPWLG